MSGIQTISPGYASAAAAAGVQAPSTTSIVISGYSPQEATLKDGTVVTVAGQYPFADNVTIIVKPGQQAGAHYGADFGRDSLALALRIPCWVDSAEVKMNSAADTFVAPLPATPCSLFHVPSGALSAASDLATGTVSLTLAFVNSIKVLENEWHNNTEAAPAAKFQHPAGAVEIRRGPLLFTFAVPSIENVTMLNETCGTLCNKFKGLKTASELSYALECCMLTVTRARCVDARSGKGNSGRARQHQAVADRSAGATFAPGALVTSDVSVGLFVPVGVVIHS
eukprot:COSAG02_NODE_2201_length_9535_cov_20.999364_8_plen_282_part_00